METNDVEKLLLDLLRAAPGMSNVLPEQSTIEAVARRIGNLATDVAGSTGVENLLAGIGSAVAQIATGVPSGAASSAGGSVVSSVVSGLTGSASGRSSNPLLSVLTSGFGISPLISGLLRLFGGGGREEPPPLIPYVPPPPIRIEGGVSAATGDAVFGVDYRQDSLPRLRQAAPVIPQVTVQVQAMDSRSFLDHSEEIARAVREAMLHSHSLNDVVTDL
ncbi:MAG: hypothetical protein IRZ15_02990 [Bryobacteraceae bacterium]|nr:hypothetical protein [Bryobacteraceae bacterium]